MRRVKLEVRPLFLPQVVRLSSLLLPGLRTVTWTSEDWAQFVDKANQAIKSFDVLVTRVHDIYTNRIIYMLTGMQEVTLITLPGWWNHALHVYSAFFIDVAFLAFSLALALGLSYVVMSPQNCEWKWRRVGHIC